MNNIELEKKVKQLVHQNRYEKGYVDVTNILLQLNYLSPKDYQAWRKGQIEYLERACQVNLSKLTLIGKAIRKHSRELGLKPSKTIVKHKQQILRYSKSGNRNVEEAYATRHIDIKRIEELKRK